MAKWAVILTVAWLCFINVSSQTNSTSPEDSAATTSVTINEEPPQTSLKEEISVSSGTDIKNDTTTTSTFPPLQHHAHPHDVPSSVETQNPSSSPFHEVVTSAEKITPNADVDPKTGAPTTKGSSSNMLLSSIIVVLGSFLLWNLNY